MQLEETRNELQQRLREVEDSLDKVGSSLNRTLEAKRTAETQALIDPNEKNKERLASLQDTASELSLREMQWRTDAKGITAAITELDQQIAAGKKLESDRRQVILAEKIPTMWLEVQADLREAMAKYVTVLSAKSGTPINRMDMRMLIFKECMSDNAPVFKSALDRAAESLEGVVTNGLD